MKPNPEEHDATYPDLNREDLIPPEAIIIPITVVVADGPDVPNIGFQQEVRGRRFATPRPSTKEARIFVTLPDSMSAFTNNVAFFINVFKPSAGTLVKDNTLLFGGATTVTKTFTGTDTHIDVGLVQEGLANGTYYATVVIMVTTINITDIFTASTTVNLTFTKP